MSDWRPGYICILDAGCDGDGHSDRCQQKNREYAEATRQQQGKERLAYVEAAIRRETDDEYVVGQMARAIDKVLDGYPQVPREGDSGVNTRELAMAVLAALKEDG